MRHPQNPNRELLIVGDRVLIKLDENEERTEAGLILPKSVVEKAQVQQGRVVAVGPGTPMPFGEDGGEDEPWREVSRQPRYIPMQAREGDFALFLRKATVEIQFEGEAYLIVPQSAILMLLRDENGLDLGEA
jgi:co-chaperonin GroES (HSP10)